MEPSDVAAVSKIARVHDGSRRDKRELLRRHDAAGQAGRRVMIQVLGVYADGHDPGACLLRDGEIVVAIEEERLTRVKHGIPSAQRAMWRRFNSHFGYFPWASLNYCLRAASVQLHELDAVVIGMDPVCAVDWSSILPIDPARIIFADQPAAGVHHYCHALSAFFASPFDRAAVLVVDGMGSQDDRGGESESGYYFEGRAGEYREVFKNRYVLEPFHSPQEPKRWGGLGTMYMVVSMALGFRDRVTGCDDAGKTMGLAPYGRPSPDFEAPWVRYDGFQLDFSRFLEFARSAGLWEAFLSGTEHGGILAHEGHFGQQAKDLAHKVQFEAERTMIHLAEQIKRETGAVNLCLAGGVALNSVANGILQASGLFDRVFVQPAAADNGQAIGLAYYGHVRLAKTPIKPIRHAFGGRCYSDVEIRRFLDACAIPYVELPDERAVAAKAADDLAASRILGWFQGGSELGPRALGHRSILGDPRRSEMKDIINARVKFREAFRPFAPSVLAERASEVFDLRGDSPYMLIVAPVRKEWADRVPAITHVDGTGRVQTVEREIDPLYHALISEFANRTGVPVVLNTSFNLRGMPIVESPRDALHCFLFTEMDALYIGRYRVAPLRPSELCVELAPRWDCHRSTSEKTVEIRFTPTVSHARGRVIAVPAIAGVDMAYVFERLDGTRSLAQVLEGACTATLPPERLDEVMRFLKRLLREGAIELRLGSERFAASIVPWKSTAGGPSG